MNKQELSTIHDGIECESDLRIAGYQILLADSRPLVFITQVRPNGDGCLWIRTPSELKKACEIEFVDVWLDEELKKSRPQRILATRIHDAGMLGDVDYQAAYRAMTEDFDRVWDLLLTGGFSSGPMNYCYLPNLKKGIVSVAEEIVTPTRWQQLSEKNTVECPSHWLDWIDNLRKDVNLATGCLTWNFSPRQCLANVRFVSEWRYAFDTIPNEVRFWAGKLDVGYEISTHVWITIVHERGCSMLDLTMVQPSIWSDELAALQKEWRQAGEPDINPMVELNNRIRKEAPSQWAVIGRVPSGWRYHGLPCSPSAIRNHYYAIRRFVKS